MYITVSCERTRWAWKLDQKNNAMKIPCKVFVIRTGNYTGNLFSIEWQVENSTD